MYSGGGKQTGKGTTYSRASHALSSKAASAAGGQRSSLKPGIRGRVSILGWNRYQSAHDRVLMNVLAMMREILRVTNAMVRKSTLPDFPVTPNFGPERVRESAFDELNGTLNRHVFRRSKHQMNMFGHDHESVQRELAFPPVPIKGLQKTSRVRFDYKERSSLPGREIYEISSRWRD